MSAKMAAVKELILLWILQISTFFSMLWEEEHAAVGGMKRKLVKKTRPRRWWVRPRLQNRDTTGAFVTLVQQLHAKDPEEYLNDFQMSPQQFDHLLQLVKHLIQKKETNFRKPIAAEIRLAVTLRYLAGGTSQRDLSYTYNIGRTSLSKIIRECTTAIWKSLHDLYVRPPNSIDDWNIIESTFRETWNFPNCVGALDGKHVQIRCPKTTGSQYSNCKGTFSFVLLAACDANYCFTMVDIGNFGQISDGCIFGNSWFGKKCLCDDLSLPQPRRIAPNMPPLPYVFVANEAFPLSKNIMQPYEDHHLEMGQRIFNYRLSRARRIIENTFGVMVARWRILQKPLDTTVETGISVVQAIVCLHNYLKKTNGLAQGHPYCPTQFVDTEDAEGNVHDGQWRVSANDTTGLLRLQLIQGQCQPEQIAKDIRNTYKEYFTSQEGSLPWQVNHVMQAN